MKKIIILTSLFLGLVSCKDNMPIEIAEVNPVAEITLDGKSIVGDNLVIEYEKSLTFKFTCSGVSYVEFSAPEGWESKTSMDNKTITLSAPAYSDMQAQKSGTVTIKIYDGRGGHIEKSFSVTALECDLDFKIKSPEITSTVNFSLGSKIWFICDMTGNVGSFNFNLPNGWTAEKSEQGFVVTAPIWSSTSGFDQDGTVSVTPVSYSGNVYDEKKASFKVHVNEKGTFQFVNPGKVTFDSGTTQTIEMIVAGVKSIDSCNAPEGWIVDYSSLLQDGNITVTAPSGQGSFKGIGELSFSATQMGVEIPIESEGETILRLRGVNDKDDLLAFREVHGATGDVTPDYTQLAPWLVDGELFFNSDIELAEEDMYQEIKAYFIHHLYVPINGNGHTLTVNFKGNRACLGLFQHIHKDIHDINIAGSFELESSSVGVVAALGQQQLNADVTISRVNSSATIIYSALGATGSARAAGLLTSAAANRTLKIVDCTVSGDIILNQMPNQAGGIMATGTNDGKNGTGLVSIEGCTFSGKIIYNKENTTDAHYNNARIGGIIGSQERNGAIKDCTFSGSIEMYLGGSTFFSTATAGGVGGILGRCNSKTSGYVMATEMTGCKSEGSITVYDSSPSESLVNYGQLVGVNLGTCSPEGCTENTTITIK